MDGTCSASRSGVYICALDAPLRDLLISGSIPGISDAHRSFLWPAKPGFVDGRSSRAGCRCLSNPMAHSPSMDLQILSAGPGIGGWHGGNSIHHRDRSYENAWSLSLALRNYRLFG